MGFNSGFKGLIIGTTGNISKSFRKYLNNITGKHDSRELQTTAALGTAYILRKEIMCEYKHLTWEIALQVAQSVQKGSNTICPRNTVCFRYSAKGDN